MLHLSSRKSQCDLLARNCAGRSGVGYISTVSVYHGYGDTRSDHVAGYTGAGTVSENWAPCYTVVYRNPSDGVTGYGVFESTKYQF